MARKKSQENVVAISGCSGFIGQRTREILEEDGYIVYPIPRVTLVKPEGINQFIKILKPDYIIHLAAYGNHSNQTDDIETINANVFKTLYLLYACSQNPYKAFINVSSSSVYGIKDRPMKETDSLDGESMYASTKISSELICRAYARKHSLPIINVRPFSIYGPTEADFRFIPTMFRHLKDNPSDRKPKMVIDPHPVHDWTMVDDFVEGLLIVMRNAQNLSGKAINIGNGRQYSNRDVLDKVEWITGRTVMWKEAKNSKPFETKHWQSDSSVIKALGWEPKYDLFQGIKLCWTEYAKRNGIRLDIKGMKK